MRVLTIKQPFASLIMHGYKKIETRGWIPKNPKLIEQIKEEGLLIHAGAGKMSKEYRKMLEQWTMQFGVTCYDKETYLEGAIIGKVNLEAFYKSEYISPVNEMDSDKIHNDVKIEPQIFDNEKTIIISKSEHAFGDYSENRFGWLLSNPIIFKEPIPAKGQLGLWNFDLKI